MEKEFRKSLYGLSFYISKFNYGRMNRVFTEVGTLHKIIETQFGNFPTYILNSGRIDEFKYIGNRTNGFVIQPLGYSVDIGDELKILSISQNRSLLICEFQIVSKAVEENSNLTIRPIRITIKTEGAKGEVLSQIPIYAVNKAFVAGIINQNEISKSIDNNADKLQKLSRNNVIKIKSMFDNVSVHFRDRPDSRMRLMTAFDKPIFIPNIAAQDSVPPIFVSYREYFSNIYKVMKEKDKFKAEMCIPIKYKKFNMIGYIQVLHSSRLDMNSYNFVNLVAGTLNMELQAADIFEESKERCPVVELSNKSVTFVHANNVTFQKMFSIGTAIYFDLFISENEKQTHKANIVTIKSDTNGHRISCDFQTPTKDGIRVYDDMMDKQKNFILEAYNK